MITMPTPPSNLIIHPLQEEIMTGLRLPHAITRINKGNKTQFDMDRETINATIIYATKALKQIKLRSDFQDINLNLLLPKDCITPSTFSENTEYFNEVIEKCNLCLELLNPTS